MKFWTLILIIVLVGCGTSVVDQVTQDSFTLYSINGYVDDPATTQVFADQYCGYEVFGKIEITDNQTKREILQSIQNGIDESDGTVASCFWPRHAVRTIEQGIATDYVICFQCLQVRIIKDDSVSNVPITRTPSKFLDKLLIDNGIPLAPKH